MESTADVYESINDFECGSDAKINYNNEGSVAIKESNTYAEIHYTDTHVVICYLETFHKSQNKARGWKRLNIIAIVDFLLLVVLPWIFLYFFAINCGKNNTVSTGKQVISTLQPDSPSYAYTIFPESNYTVTSQGLSVNNSIAAIDNGPTTELFEDTTKSVKCSKALLDNFVFDMIFAIPFIDVYVTDLTFVSATRYFVIIQHFRQIEIKELYEVNEGKVNLFINSTRYKQPFLIKYFKSQNVIYVSYISSVSLRIVMMGLNGAILKEFEETAFPYQYSSFFEGPNDKVYFDHNGVREISGNILFHLIRGVVSSGVYLNRYKVFILLHYFEDYKFVVLFRNRTVGWSKSSQSVNKSYWTKALTLAPCGNEALYLDCYHKLILSIDHTGRFTSKLNIFDYPFECLKMKQAYPIAFESIGSESILIALRNGNIIKIKRKKECVCS